MVAERQARVTHQLKYSLNSDNLPSSLGRFPVKYRLDKYKDAAKKKEMDEEAKNEKYTGIVILTKS
jgi:hypothetical protein